MDNDTKAVKRSISFPGNLLQMATSQADREHRSLSGYVSAVVATDLQRKGVITCPHDEKSTTHARVDELMEAGMTPAQVIAALEEVTRKEDV